MIDVFFPATGNPFLDVVFTGLPHIPAAGQEVLAENVAFLPGGSLTAAIVLSRLGLNVMYEAQLGDDFASRFLLAEMKREGVSTDAVTVVPGTRACVTVAYNHNNDRSFLSFAPPTPPPRPELVDRYQPRAVLVDGLRVGPAVIETLARARTLRALRLADVQDTAPTLADPATAELLSQLDVITLNEREVLQLTCTTDLTHGLNTLRGLVGTVVLKRGADGARALWANGEVELPAIPAKVVDLTGCGDNFFAALTAAFLEGQVINECLAWANAAGHLAALSPGGTGGRYSRADLLELVERHYADRLAPDPLQSVTLEPHD